jgi:formylglycine-generating enzyme required for sulfatase activity
VAPTASPSPLASGAPSALSSATASPEAPAPASPPVRPASTAGMVLLPGGTFRSKETEKTVTVAAFWLDATEVTARAYRDCVVAGKCTEDGLGPDCDDLHPVNTYARPGKENHPINCVDQAQAIAYCAFAGKRLPTVVEWEWAARGATRGSTYPWGEEAPDKQLCWKRTGFFQNVKGVKGTCAVRSFPQGNTPQGIADLAGNVSEWTKSVKPGIAPVHGGDWMETHPGSVEAGFSRPAYADSHLPGQGFRCAGDEPAASP